MPYSSYANLRDILANVREANSLEEKTHPSKRLRFEIFKRDHFTCQYCGRQPPEVTLVVDHVDPVANGGKAHELNLVTSCVDCNQGKGAALLTEIPNKPDAREAYLQLQQELAEARRFLELKREFDAVQQDVVRELQHHWHDIVKTKNSSVPSETQVLFWLRRYEPEEITEAFYLFSFRYNSYPEGREQFKDFVSMCKYVSGILRKNRQRRDQEKANDESAGES
jgi:5-methylcytosine-specific restriction endonuclease McrA